jgi:hypothetical protein
MKFRIIVAAFTLVVSSTATATDEVMGLDWLDKHRDSSGCIPLNKVAGISSKTKECPHNVEPQIRPKTVGTLNTAITKVQSKGGKELCCYDWATYGNR